MAGGKKTAADLGAWLIFEDESGQGLRPPKGRTWGRRGQTPVVKVTGGQNTRVSLAALIAVKPGCGPRLIYRVHRSRAGRKDQAHQKLALWCEQNGLKDQAVAHFHQALRLDPSREVAWKHLGYKKVGGRWQKPEAAAAAKHEAQEQQRANKHWRPILEKLRANLKSKDKARRADADKALGQITDRRAVPMVWATLGMGDSAHQKIAVQVLGQIDDPSASRALVLLAVFGGSPEVRARATQSLGQRDAREFADTLIAMIRQPIEYEVKRVRGPGQGGELLIKGQGSAANLSE